MASNEWINGYLEAILDAGSAARKKVNEGNNKIMVKNISKFESSSKDKTDQLFSPTKYFVEEVVNGFDESDLHRTWIKVIATRTAREPGSRLENMCWRIWHLARKKKQIQWDESQRLAKRRREREEGRHDAAADLSELSEGEKESGHKLPLKPDLELERQDSLGPLGAPIMARINSEVQLSWPSTEQQHQHQQRQLYIVLISMHGLIRGDNMELGRDSDTGGQVKYVVELARALAATPGVYRVDLLTRQITSPDVDSSYGEPNEMLFCSPEAAGSSGAYIVRIPCGPASAYLPKESLWPHVPDFVDAALSHIVNMARALGDELSGSSVGRPVWPYVIHGHYADGGLVAARLSASLNVPMVLTGHSLGRNKLEQLMKQGRVTREEINETYKIARRIEGEELGLDVAEMVVTSTRQEIEEQWGLYDGFDLKLERKLRVRRRRGVSCLGRYMPRMVVIPPGMDFSNVTAQDSISDADLKSLIASDRSHQSKRNLPPIWSEIMRFFTNPHKPIILALSRPDPKKNVTTLLRAYGECQALRELANLTLILGNREDIEEMSNSSSSELTTMLKLIDRYDLYGQVAYPKHHKQSDVPEIYRLAAKTKGVFINPALVEPFGLTLIEAAAYGLPVVATKNGGPVDILRTLNNGLLVDPHDQKDIEDALLKLVGDKNLWLDCRKNGLKNIHRYSWTEHCRNYLSHVEHCRNRHSTTRLQIMPIPEEPMSDSLKDVEDLSLRFSVDLEFKSGSDHLDTAAATRQKELVEAITRSRMASSNGNAGVAYSPGRRQRLFVIATDCYADGDFAPTLRSVITSVMEAASSLSGVGFALLTGSTLEETLEALKRFQVNVEDFDALICRSGTEMYYPWVDLVSDADYASHIEYRWPGENVRSMVTRLAKAENAPDGEIYEYTGQSSNRCYSYNLKHGAKARKSDDLRQRLRMRGFRCNLIYTRAASRLNVMPLYASRIQTLRYLSVKWGIELSKMVVFVGEKGDTDIEDLLAGHQKTLVLKGSVEYGSEELLRGEEGYKREDAVPSDSPDISYSEGFDAHDVLAALEAFGVK